MTLSLELPYATPDLPGTGGRIRELCEDFVVEEIPAYEPAGHGEHLFVNLTRRGMNTRDVAMRLAKLFDVPRKAVGYAGLKDKYSQSTQTFSVLIGKPDPMRSTDLEALIGASLPVTVNWVGLHTRKMRAGHLLGNRFTINITGVEVGVEEAVQRAREITNHLRESGLPNFYGPQRVEKENVRRGRETLKGSRRVGDRWLRRFLVTCYIDHLCNLYLRERIRRGIFHRLIRGDIAKKYATGGMFVVEQVEAEQVRYEKREISFTAPIYGPKMWDAEGPSRMLELEIMEGEGVTPDELGRLGVRGSRRLGRLIPDVMVEPAKRGIRLSFNLPKGAYATCVTREIMKSEA
jgi:tRNA pseudouridine13 synthase